MKKQKKSIIIGIVIAVTATAAAAAGTHGTLSQPQKQQPGVQLTAQRSAAVGELEDPVYTYLGTHYSGEERYMKVRDYAAVKAIYQPTLEEKNIMVDMLERSMKLEDVLSLYQFWFTTNENVTFLQKASNIWTPEMTEMEFWEEDIYNIITRNTDLLEKEQMIQYLESGLQRGDINLANQLSRKKVFTISQILQHRKNGESWIKIINQIYNGLQYSLELSQQDLERYQDINGADILRAISLVKTSGKPITYWLNLCLGDDPQFEYVSSDFLTEIMTNELEALKGTGLNGETQEEQLARQSLQVYTVQKLQKMGIPAEEVQQLQQQGIDDMDLLEAAEEMQRSGVPLTQQLVQ